VNYLKVSIGIFLALSVSRFIPHPPNFTSLIALSFYVPAIFGTRYISIVVFSLILTDLIIGFHSTIMFRISGALTGAILFFILTNFGVWINGSYGYTLNGFLSCYILALPFFGYSLISTFIFSSIIEGFFRLIKKQITFSKF
jgi:hypothetical protein